MICNNCKTECGDDDTAICVRCHEAFCQICHHDHRNLLHVNDKDDYFVIEDIKQNFNEDNYQGSKYCKRHKDARVMWFCQTCSYSICDNCAIKRHTNHKVMSLNTYIPDIQNALQGCHNMLAWTDSQLTELTTKLLDQKVNAENKYLKLEHEIKYAIHSNIMQYLVEMQRQEHRLLEELRVKFEQNGSNVGSENLSNAQCMRDLVDRARKAVKQCIKSQTVVFKKGVFQSLGMINGLDFEKLLLPPEWGKFDVKFAQRPSNKIKRATKSAAMIGKLILSNDRDLKESRVLSNSAPDLMTIPANKETLARELYVDDVEEIYHGENNTTTGETDTDFGEFIVTPDFQLIRKAIPSKQKHYTRESSPPITHYSNHLKFSGEQTQKEQNSSKFHQIEKQKYLNSTITKTTNPTKIYKKEAFDHSVRDRSAAIGEPSKINNKYKQMPTRINKNRSSSPFENVNLYNDVLKYNSVEKERRRHAENFHSNTKNHDLSKHKRHRRSTLHSELEQRKSHPLVSQSMYHISKPPSTRSSPVVQQVIRQSSSSATRESIESESRKCWNIVSTPEHFTRARTPHSRQKTSQDKTLYAAQRDQNGREVVHTQSRGNVDSDYLNHDQANKYKKHRYKSDIFHEESEAVYFDISGKTKKQKGKASLI